MATLVLLHGVASAQRVAAAELAQADPAYDTPEVLKEYGGRYGADFTNWQFLTGDAAEIQAAAQDANVIYEDMGEGNFTHNMNTVLIGPDGAVRERFHGSGWKVHEVVKRIQEIVSQR